MAEDDLTVRARIDDELSRPLEGIRDTIRDVGDEADSSSRRASRSSRGWDTYGKATEKAGKLAHSAGRLIRGAALAAAAGIAAAAYAAGRLARSSITEASSLNESLNAVNVTYGKQASAVKKLGREAAKSLGLSNVEFNGMAVQFSSFATAIGGEGKGAVKTLDAITTRAADFASVMNIEVAEATALFQSGLAGESEPLRKYGINLSAAAVGAYAVEAGLSKSATTLTDAAKIQATYGLLMEKTATAQGDFANTSDSLANQQRILGARFDNAKAKLGKGLLPMMTTAVQYLNREGIPAFLRFSDWFTEEGLPAIGRFISKGRALYEKHLPKIKAILSDVKDVGAKAADAATALVDAFAGMPSWARKLLLGGAAAGIIGKKTGAFGLLKGIGKGAGGLAGLASKAAPLPVFVTNMGLGLGGVAGAAGAGGAAATWGAKAAAAVKFGLTKGSIVLGGITLADALWKAGDLDNAGPMKAINDSGRKTGEWVRNKFGNQNTTKTQANGEANPWASIYKGNAKDVSRKIDAALDATRMKAAGLGTELDLVGARKIDPTIKADSIDRANAALATFIGKQIEAGRPVAPYITLNGYAQAMQQINTLTAGIHAIPSLGVDGVPYVSGGGASSAPEPPRNPPERPRPQPRPPVMPTRPRPVSGTVTVAPGAIVVNNPASNIDLEAAIANGIRDYTREREER